MQDAPSAPARKSGRTVTSTRVLVIWSQLASAGTGEGVARRVTYTLDPERKAVTLTTFRKQRQNERAEILRARRAKAAHDAERQEAQRTKKKGK